MKVSIIVPVFNEEKTIPNCLNALVNQNYPREDYEIVVVNDGSIDNTKNIIKRYPARIINLDKNSGRVIAREVGAKNAKYDSLLFIDSRCIADLNLLKKLKDINYQPLISGDYGEEKYRSNFDCLFYLIRRRVYYHYPQTSYEAELWIDNNNFDRIHKGTGCFFCSKSLFLRASPQDKGHTVSDDTKLFRNIIKEKRILKHTDIKIKYLQRTGFIEVIKHIYNRGPRFVDYYLLKGGEYHKKEGRYYKVWQVILWVTILSICLGVYRPIMFLYEIGILLMFLIGWSIHLSENAKDFLIVFTHFPLIAVTFGLGIIKGKILGKRRTF